jgi:hypothetical protein
MGKKNAESPNLRTRSCNVPHHDPEDERVEKKEAFHHGEPPPLQYPIYSSPTLLLKNKKKKRGSTTALFDIPRPRIAGPEWLKSSAHVVPEMHGCTWGCSVILCMN